MLRTRTGHRSLLRPSRQPGFRPRTEAEADRPTAGTFAQGRQPNRGATLPAGAPPLAAFVEGAPVYVFGLGFCRNSPRASEVVGLCECFELEPAVAAVFVDVRD